MSGMKRVDDPSGALRWLADRPPEESVTGYDPLGWPGSTWVLHAMYENPALSAFGTHDDVHRQRRESGVSAPVFVGDVDLDSIGTLTGTSLGFVIHPGHPWQRITWEQYLARFPDFTGNREYPPGHRWFPPGSWPVAVQPPSEGSLDAESLDALVTALATQSPDGPSTRCFAFYGSLPAGDFDTVHLWEGQLDNVHELLRDNGGPYGFSPTNLWSADHDWFVLTYYDLQASKVSGASPLIDALVSRPDLECISWEPRRA